MDKFRQCAREFLVWSSDPEILSKPVEQFRWNFREVWWLPITQWRGSTSKRNRDRVTSTLFLHFVVCTKACLIPFTSWNAVKLCCWTRGELSYLAPLGSENISAPYFKQCFFRGWGDITPQIVKHHASQSQDRNNKYFILYIEFCINNKI